MVCISLRYSNLTQYDGLNVSVFVVPEKRFFQAMMLCFQFLCRAFGLGCVCQQGQRTSD